MKRFEVVERRDAKMIKTVEIEKDEVEETVDNFDRSNLDMGITDLVPSDQVYNRIDDYLHNAPLNIKKNDYCYIKIVKNHLEIGRAKIVLQE